MHSDGIRHGTTTAWRLYIGGVVTGLVGSMAFHGAAALVGAAQRTIDALVDTLATIPWQ